MADLVVTKFKSTTTGDVYEIADEATRFNVKNITEEIGGIEEVLKNTPKQYTQLPDAGKHIDEIVQYVGETHAEKEVNGYFYKSIVSKYDYFISPSSLKVLPELVSILESDLLKFTGEILGSTGIDPDTYTYPVSIQLAFSKNQDESNLTVYVNGSKLTTSVIPNDKMASIGFIGYDSLPSGAELQVFYSVDRTGVYQWEQTNVQPAGGANIRFVPVQLKKADWNSQQQVLTLEIPSTTTVIQCLPDEKAGAKDKCRFYQEFGICVKEIAYSTDTTSKVTFVTNGTPDVDVSVLLMII